MPSLPLILVTLAPVCYFQWLIAARMELSGAAMDIVRRRLNDEGCDLERELLADLSEMVASVKRKDFCLRLTWCLAGGYLVGDLMRGGR
jgi:hypothetical protein